MQNTKAKPAWKQQTYKNNIIAHKKYVKNVSAVSFHAVLLVVGQ